MALVRLSRSSLSTDVGSGRKGNSFYAYGVPYNVATGGNVTEFVSTGQAGTVSGARYRVHEFTSNGQSPLNVIYNSNTFDVVLIGGGFAGGAWAQPGGAGGRILNTTVSLPKGNNAVSIGVSSGGNTTLGTLSSSAGVAGSNGGAGVNGGTSNVAGNPGQAGTTITISGSSQTFSGGGGSGGWAGNSTGQPYGTVVGGGSGGAGGGGGGGSGTVDQGTGGATGGSAGQANTGGGGGGGGGSQQGQSAGGGAGGSGRAFVRYLIA